MASTASLPSFLLPRTSWQSSSSLGLQRAVVQPSQRRPFHNLPHTNKFPPRSIARVPKQRLLIRSHTLQNFQANALKAIRPTASISGSRSFSTTPVRPRDHHFDTLKFVQRLRDEGFSDEQSKAMMLVLSDVIEESIQNLTRTMVPKEGKPTSLIERTPRGATLQLEPCPQFEMDSSLDY